MNSTIDAITIKGTRHGLLIAIREDAEFALALQELAERLERDQGFLGSSSMSVDLGWREMSEAQFRALEETLQTRQIQMAGVLSTSLNTRTEAEKRGHKAIIGRLGLAKHAGRNLKKEKPQTVVMKTTEVIPVEPTPPPPLESEAQPVAEKVAEAVVEPPAPPDEKEQEATLYIKRTLRSGQKALYAGNVVVMGDVNPGAEIDAEGDVVIIGTLRGRVYAQGQIWAQVMQPTQLRIGEAIWASDKPLKFTGPVRAVLVGEKIQLQAGA